MFELLRLQPGRPDRAVHGYIYYRWTTAYVAAAKRALQDGWRPRSLRRWAGGRLARSHHAKVVPASQARRLLQIDRPIELRNTELVVPYPLARDVVLDAPPRIALAECACRVAARLKGTSPADCGPVNVCLYMGEPIASFVVRHRRGRARFVDVAEATAVVDAAADGGNLHTLWFKDAAAGRMYALCNCCRCCCTGLSGHGQGFGPLAPSGLLAVVDSEACTVCGDCVAACAFGAVAVGERAAAVDSARCFGCGVCVTRCSHGALGLESVEGASVEALQL